MFPLEPHTIFLTLAGSQAQGTAREGSDIDLRGVCIAPLPVRLSLFRNFEQFEGPLPDELANAALPRLQDHPTASEALGIKTECVIYDVAKFLRLCATANPSALEILFADERDWVFETPPWRRLHDERHQFLTTKTQQTFLGYALAQLRRIRTHRAWLLNPPSTHPSRKDFGLPQSGTVGAPKAEKNYRAATTQWESFQAWKAHRNPARAALERAYGYDTKHAMHLVRLMRTGLEILETGELRVRREDAAELCAIRDGALTFEELESSANLLEESMKSAAETSTLPAGVDPDRVDALLHAILTDP